MANNALRALIFAASISIAASHVWASDGKTLTIIIPLHSWSSSVQRLNRDGVELVKKHDYDKAERLFLKAYLYDPGDPFTLNNLGYIAELQGQLDRAQKFYELASEQSCNAVIDASSAKELQGKPMRAAIEGLKDSPMQINHWNVEAVRLLSQNRGHDAIDILKRALALDPQNPFTLNNLGVASEVIGDDRSALRYYDAVASQHSSEAVVITDDHIWGGKPVSQMAEASAKRLEKQLAESSSGYSQAAMLDRRGVAAANENDLATARRAFLQAYSIDPASAFSLNNRGYVAEMDGDLETAQFFYEKAAKAADADARIGLATQRPAEGKQLFSVAVGSGGQVDNALQKYSEQRHLQTAPIELTPRGAVPTGDTATPSQKSSSSDQGSPTTTPQIPR